LYLDMVEPTALTGVRTRVLHSAAFAAFFLSGASSLVFQTLWSRLLSHVFGSSSIAVSSVVSVFMGGLGLGAYLAGKHAERLRDPLLIYAFAECAVGCLALLIPYLLVQDGFLAQVNAALRASLGSDSRLFLVARFACIVPILIVPTTLMGSTLPLLSQHFVAAHSGASEASRTVGRLYAVNTFGAVIGVFASSFVLMPRFGVHTANSIAACSNFALAALLLGLRRGRIASAAPQLTEPNEAESGQSHASLSYPKPLRRAAALAFAGSGFASLLYEVVWSRALINTIGGSLYSFALILTTFLTGIATGSALLSALFARRVRPLTLAANGGSIAAALVFAPWAVHSGPVAGAWAVISTLALLTVSALFARISGDRLALLAGEDSVADAQAYGAARERRSAFALLALPSASAAIAVFQRPDRLSWATFGVVSAFCVFLALLLATYKRPYACLIALQVFIAGATWMSAAFADELSLTFASMVAPLADELPDHVGTVQVFMFLTAALCVLPSALGMGAVFPASLRVWTSGGSGIAKDVGVVYAGNTVGSIFGAWLPGFVLMPLLGMQQTLFIGIAWSLLSAGALACLAIIHTPTAPPHPRPMGERESDPARAPRHAATLTASTVPWLLALVAFAALRPERLLGWDISRMTLGAFRISLARDVLDEETWGAPELVYYRDGLSTTVTVERWGRHLSLKNNGKVDASNGDDMPTQIMVAALPLLLHKPTAQPLDAAVIGFGSGVTVGAALSFPVRSLEVIELERAIVDASRWFADVNHLHYVQRDFPYVVEPRLRVIADDGRNYLAATRNSYDVIISEPSNPWLTGVSDLFTSDHFATAKRRLKPGGVYCQWAQLYELSPRNVQTLYRTFAHNFRYVIAFAADDQSSDTILVGSDEPLPLNIPRIEERLRIPSVEKELARARIRGPESVLARVLMASREEVLKFSADAPLNTDDNARIELTAPRDLIGFERHQGYLETMYGSRWPFGRIADRIEGLGTGTRASDQLTKLALALLGYGRTAEVPVLLERARQYADTPQLAAATRAHALLTGQLPEPDPSLDSDPTPLTGEARAIALLQKSYAAIRAQLAEKHYATAVGALEALPTRLRQGGGPGWAWFESYIRYKAGHYDGAIECLEDVLRTHPEFVHGHFQLYYFLARAHQAELHFGQAVRYMQSYVAGPEPTKPAGAP
jgi:spermidine synthase